TVSTAALFGVEQVAGYAAAKGGLLGLTKSLAREGASLGIRVNAISPGAHTRLTDGMFKPGKGYTWRPELVAPAVLYLASHRCEHSGIVLSARAGHYARSEVVESRGTQLDPRQIISVDDFVQHLSEVLDLSGAETLTHGLGQQVLGVGARG